ncbi:uncharacterized protein LACBIDRAFT_239030 [Laccaria bicolor S238N-H82]|uniref:Predicted protein n=1 Tax=Laccaria bicolor (strain S238N-H82 / ATCC MYA-4686) TaxID=486041 RepID=B0DRI2_LACBS|nr:uncharacterized protein LACBIDRAFT_239030 [Laccaria bicolor S238N-H82]EDR02787.1 predicted protein [Laccaria bicolor S238N-H82]|eukprot:XP_001886497.1 predicted protein [Laccaria bicolor S238N-H82]
MPFDQDAYGDGFFPPQQFGGVNQPTSNHVEPPRPTFDKRSTAKLLRKLDWNLIPFIALLYFLALLDSTNIVNFRAVTVLQRDLKMKGLDYSVALALFFPFYAVAAIPSNLFLRKIGPSRWLCIITMATGLCMTLMGTVKTFGTLLVARSVLGFAEGGIFPGIIFYVTFWYRRYESGLRMAIIFSAATLGVSFNGLLGHLISYMGGIGGRPSWAWTFILEGLATILVAFLAKFLIHDGPETARFLKAVEHTQMKERLVQDHPSLSNEHHSRYITSAFKDWKIYVHILIAICIYTPLYSIFRFLPTIVKNMDYFNDYTQLMTVAPAVLGCIITIVAGFISDKTKRRGAYMMLFCVPAILGYVLMISTRDSHVQYAGAFLVISGVYPNVPIGVAWNANNIGGSTKRAVGIAMQIGFGHLGGVISAFLPILAQGHIVSIGMLTLSFFLCLFMHRYLLRENSRRDAEMMAQGLTLESYSEEQKFQEHEKGDDASFFRYSV